MEFGSEMSWEGGAVTVQVPYNNIIIINVDCNLSKTGIG